MCVSCMCDFLEKLIFPGLVYLTYNLWSKINVQGFFSGFAGNSRARKTNKAKINRVNIMGVEYFPAYQHVVSTSSYTLYPLFSLLPHYL